MLETVANIAVWVNIGMLLVWIPAGLRWSYLASKHKQERDQAYLSIALRGLKTPEEQEQTMQMRMVADEEEV